MNPKIEFLKNIGKSLNYDFKFEIKYEGVTLKNYTIKCEDDINKIGNVSMNYGPTSYVIRNMYNEIIIKFSLSAYPHCCGIYILSDIFVIKNKYNYAVQIFNCVRAYCLNNCVALLQFVINDKQQRALSLINKYCEEPITSLVNPNSSNTIYLFNHDMSGFTAHFKNSYAFGAEAVLRNLINSTKIFPMTFENVERLKKGPIN